jgi:hypothetical protein
MQFCIDNDPIQVQALILLELAERNRNSPPKPSDLHGSVLR